MTLLPSVFLKFPVQFLESALEFILAGVLFFYTDRHIERAKHGFEIYLGTYAVLRFFLEYLRGDERGIYGGLSTSQWLSLALLAAVVWYTALWSRRRGNAGKTVKKGEG